MPSLKETKSRIASVNSTLKITTAMKMVSSAKLHHAQAAIGNMVPYQKQLHTMLSSLLSSDESLAGKIPLLSGVQGIQDEDKPAPKVAVVAFSSNTSLCGAFNSNIIKKLTRLCSTLDNPDIYTVGKKVSDAIRKAGYSVTGDWSEMADKPSYEQAADLSECLCSKFLEGKYSRVIFVYNHFASTGSQPAVQEDYLPFTFLRSSESCGTSFEYIVEPDAEQLALLLSDKVLKLKTYTVLLDANTAEHAARVVAMQTASDNAESLLSELTLQYNKSRQQAITSEILDIVSGSLA